VFFPSHVFSVLFALSRCVTDRCATTSSSFFFFFLCVCACLFLVLLAFPFFSFVSSSPSGNSDK
jgi:hypothetical protein